MNLENLKNINDILNKDLEAKVFFVFKSAEKECTLDFRLVNLEEQKAEKAVIEVIKNSLLEKVRVEDLELRKLSLAENEKNVIYEYDYNEVPELLQQVVQFVDEEVSFESGFGSALQKFFSKSNDKIADLFGLLIILNSEGKRIKIFKKHYPISLLQTGRGCYLTDAGNIFECVDDRDYLRITNGVDLVVFNGVTYVFNIDVIEKYLGFDKIIMANAADAIEWMKKSGLIDGVEVIEDNLENISVARKLAKVAKSSPVIKLKITNQDLIQFTKDNSEFDGMFEFTDDESKFVIRKKIAIKNILMLLNDEFLFSKLTKIAYHSSSKESM